MDGIGGFLDIELRKKEGLHPKALALNSCRNALRFLVERKKIRTVYIAYYTCDAVYNALLQSNVSIEFYHIDKNLLPIGLPNSVDSETIILYTNYWGICENQINWLLNKYGSSVVVDAAQAFFYKPPYGIYAIHSARKFFGVPDGGFLYGNISLENLSRDKSFDRFSHLLQRFECGAEKAYSLYKKAEEKVDKLEILRMSKLTEALLGCIDYSDVYKKRKSNFEFLHSFLGDKNLLNINKFYTIGSVPMVYPYKTKDITLRQRLIDHKVFVATYWPNVLQWCNAESVEYDLAINVIPLPIDQRYTVKEITKIVNLIN